MAVKVTFPLEYFDEGDCRIRTEVSCTVRVMPDPYGIKYSPALYEVEDVVPLNREDFTSLPAKVQGDITREAIRRAS